MACAAVAGRSFPETGRAAVHRVRAGTRRCVAVQPLLPARARPFRDDRLQLPEAAAAALRGFVWRTLSAVAAAGRCTLRLERMGLLFADALSADGARNR